MLNIYADMFKRQLDMSNFRTVASKSHPIMLKLHVISTCRIVMLNCYTIMFKH